LAPPESQEEFRRRPSIGPVLLVAALLAALAIYVVPRGLAARTQLAIADDSARIAERALNEKFNAGLARARSRTQGTNARCSYDREVRRGPRTPFHHMKNFKCREICHGARLRSGLPIARPADRLPNEAGKSLGFQQR